MSGMDYNDSPRTLDEVDVRNVSGKDGHNAELGDQSHVDFSKPDNSKLPGHQKIPVRNRESDLLSDAVHQTVASGEDGVAERFGNIVRDRRKLASKQKTFLRATLYIFILCLFGVGLYIIDYYVPTPHLTIVFPLLILAGVIIFLIWIGYRYCGRARWALNWRLKKTSRYLDACQVPDEYVEQMLPKLGPEADGVCHCRLAGSSGDGFGFFPSLSANVGVCNKVPPLTQDIDMNFFYDALQLQKEDLVCEGMPPGFCWIRLDSRINFFDSFVRDCLVNHPMLPGLYLSGKLVSDKIGRYIPNNVEYNYPAVTYTNILNGPQGKYKFDVDIVFGIKIPLWPDVAKDWPTSSNRRLPQEMIDNIVRRGCYIVHKHCDNKQEHFPIAHEEHNLDWRFTFAEAESELFKYHGEKEALKLCYVIIKFVIKLYSTKKKKKFPALKSYHLKTLFLRIAEAETQYNMYNIKNSKDLGPMFMMVLSEYKRALQEKHLPHYFMPSMNILALYTDAELQEGIKLIEEFERKPLFVIDMFDKSWISRRKLDWLLILGFIAIFFCYGMKFYFDYRKETLLGESRTLLLEALGEENRDLLHLADDPDKLTEFYDCIKKKNSLVFGTDRRRRDVVPVTDSSVTDSSVSSTTLFDLGFNTLWQLVIRQCRIELNLN